MQLVREELAKIGAEDEAAKNQEHHEVYTQTFHVDRTARRPRSASPTKAGSRASMERGLGGSGSGGGSDLRGGFDTQSKETAGGEGDGRVDGGVEVEVGEEEEGEGTLERLTRQKSKK